MDKDTAHLLEELAKQLGTTAQHLWAVLIRQAYISFWTDLIFYAITIACAGATFYIGVRLYRKGTDPKTDWIDTDLWKVGGLACAIVSAVLLIACAFSIEGTVTKLANPEMYALSQILAALHH